MNIFSDVWLQLNAAMFEQNFQSGYVLKPSHMRPQKKQNEHVDSEDENDPLCDVEAFMNENNEKTKKKDRNTLFLSKHNKKLAFPNIQEKISYTLSIMVIILYNIYAIFNYLNAINHISVDFGSIRLQK